VLHYFVTNSWVRRYNICILAAAKWHACERARLQSIGKTPPFVDGQIAAIAYVNNLILVTRNITDFDSFSDLQIQSWHSGGRNRI